MSAAVPALAVEGLAKRYGGLVVTDDVSLSLAPGEVHALIGPNGAGKTTLVNQVSGRLAPDRGRVRLAGRDVTRLSVAARARLGLARSFQITSVLPGFSALENVALAVQARAGRSAGFGAPAAADEALNAPAREALAQVGLAHRAGAMAGDLSHGEKRALEVAVALAMDPKVVLLDEPMAGAGREEAARLLALLASLKGRFAVLLVEHDMGAVFALADRVSVLVRGRVVASGAPDAVRADPAVRAAYLGDEGGAGDEGAAGEAA